MPGTIRTTAEHPDFIMLVRQLDADLAIRDGADHAFYTQFNKLDQIKHVIIAYADEKPVGCGAMKTYEPGSMEIKRMYVLPECRGQGIATKVLAALEAWASELSVEACVLETGLQQPEAIALYQKNGYVPIPNYGQYAGVETSVCFKKELG